MTKEELINKSEYGYNTDKGIWSKCYKRFLKGTVNKCGYVQVYLKCTDGTYRLFYVHRAMWYLAYGTIPEGMQVNHIDENKLNNSLSNLNLMTPKENVNWGTGIERRAAKQRGQKRTEETKSKMSESHKGKPHLKLKGIPRPDMIEQNKRLLSKPVVAVKDGVVVMEFSSTIEAGRNGFDQGHVSACCIGKRKTHKGYRWYFKSEWEQIKKASLQ